ncbi:MAG TPA: redoxin family protein [Candidatus Limnocylindria bacterium]|nr:redoxin family protein [Candidatus Limnocylindria bacterium]
MRTLRWLLIPAIVLPLGWLLLTGFGRDPREIATPLIGREAPAWTYATLDGETLSSADLTGRPYVLNFWASWCIPACVEEHPVLADAAERLGDRVAFVGVLYQDSPTDAEAFLARYGDAGYPHLVDAAALAVDYGVTGPPETWFVDAEGVVRARKWGPLTDATMREYLAAIGVSG